LRFANEIDLQRHDFKTVAERAQDMVKYEPSDGGTWGNLGDALMELGEYQRGRSVFAHVRAQTGIEQLQPPSLVQVCHG